MVAMITPHYEFECGADLESASPVTTPLRYAQPLLKIRRGAPCFALSAGVVLNSSSADLASAPHRRAMAILAMPDHGQDARATPRCRPQGRLYISKCDPVGEGHGQGTSFL